MRLFAVLALCLVSASSFAQTPSDTPIDATVAADGQYTGYLTGNDGTHLSGMILQLQSLGVVGAHTETSVVQLVTDSVIALAMQGTSFDPSTGALTAEVSVQGSTDVGVSSHMLIIQGIVQGNSIKGTMYDIGYPSKGASFELIRGGIVNYNFANDPQLAKSPLGTSSRRGIAHTFYGDSNGYGRTSLTVATAPKTAVASLVDVLAKDDERIVTATLNFGQDVNVILGFDSAILDQSGNSLAARQYIPTSGVTIGLVCGNFDFNATVTYDFTCTYSGPTVQQYHFSNAFAP